MYETFMRYVVVEEVVMIRTRLVNEANSLILNCVCIKSKR